MQSGPTTRGKTFAPTDSPNRWPPPAQAFGLTAGALDARGGLSPAPDDGRPQESPRTRSATSSSVRTARNGRVAMGYAGRKGRPRLPRIDGARPRLPPPERAGEGLLPATVSYSRNRYR